MKKLAISLVLLVILSVSSQGAANVPILYASSNQFKAGTNEIYLQTLTDSQTTSNFFKNLVYSTNVVQAGADPLGVSDSTLAISNAIVNLTNFGTVYFPPGRYKVGKLSFIGKNNKSLISSGAEIYSTETNDWQFYWLNCTNWVFNGLTFNGGNVVRIINWIDDNAETFTYRDCKIINGYFDNHLDSGGTSIGAGILVDGGKNISVYNTTFSNIWYSSTGNVSRTTKALYFGGPGGAPSTNRYLKNVKAIGNTFTHILGDTLSGDSDCISIQDQIPLNEVGYVISGNTFRHFSHRAVKCYSNSGTISGNTIDNSERLSGTFGGISAYGKNLAITGNSIKGRIYASIDSISGGGMTAENLTINGNVITYVGDNTGSDLPKGIMIDEGTTNATISGNTINNVRVGVNVYGLSKGINIIGNTFSNISVASLWVAIGSNSLTYPNQIAFRDNFTQGNVNNIVQNDGGTNVHAFFNLLSGTATNGYTAYTGGATGTRLMNGVVPAITTSTLDFGSIAAAASADLTITVTGASTGDPVSLSLPSAPAAGIVFNTFVSAANTVTVRASNITGSPVDPASASYTVQVFKQ